jgi:hypothetical protein
MDLGHTAAAEQSAQQVAVPKRRGLQDFHGRILNGFLVEIM